MPQSEASKARLLVLGGLGSIGRNFVKYCVDNNLCSFIRVVDKTMPMIAMLSPDHAAAFKSDEVEFCQADLTRAEHIERAFKGEPFQFIVNLASETKYGKPTAAYESSCRDLAVRVATRAQTEGAKFVQVSTGQVYKCNSKTPTAEDGEKIPFTTPARYQLEAEQMLQKLAQAGLDLVIVRPATVYGPGDVTGLMPRCVCAVRMHNAFERTVCLASFSISINTSSYFFKVTVSVLHINMSLLLSQTLFVISCVQASYVKLKEKVRVVTVDDGSAVCSKQPELGFYYCFQMKFLWDAKTKLNTVHVLDVCRALWHVCVADACQGAEEKGGARAYNIVDQVKSTPCSHSQHWENWQYSWQPLIAVTGIAGTCSICRRP